MQKKLPENTTMRRHIPDDDTRELIALMDIIPNAKSVAVMYQQMMQSGSLDARFVTGDPGKGWLEAEQIILDRMERKKGNRRKLIWMIVIFILVGIISCFSGMYLLTIG